jgi:hypothetical protein
VPLPQCLQYEKDFFGGLFWYDNKMKEVHIRRHAEKKSDGSLSKNGIEAAKKLSKSLPKFAKVVSSDSSRAQRTAYLMTGCEAAADTRAGMYMASPEKSDAINQLAVKHSLTFLEAVDQYQDKEILDGIEARANELNQLVDELFNQLQEDEKALIVSHDLSIIAAMTKRNIAPNPIDLLEGYILREDGSIRSTS